jgi:ABC-2 type transport system permease protein
MTTVTARAGASTKAGTANGGTTTGAGTLLRFMLRRERRGLPWWLLGVTFLWTYQSVGSQSLYDTPEKLARLRDTLGANAALVAMSGPKELLDTIGGEVVFEIFAYSAVVVALMNMFLIGRHTRSDEDTGRAELIRSARVGRHAPLAAALGLAGLANLAVAVLVFAGMAGTGLPVAGSLVVAGAVAGVGLTFAALTAVAVQVFESPRALYGAVGAAMGAAFMLRAAGDAGDGTLSWLSPFGWGQRTFPYVENRLWPLVLPIVATVVLVAIAVALQDRRDLGAGLLPTRPGRPTASWALRSPLGLAWRLQRGALIGWTSGLLLLGAAYGSFGDAIEQYIADNPEVANFFPGGAANIVNSYLAFTMLFCALITAAYGVTSALRARGEEASGRAEPVLATATSRASWLSSHLIVAMAGSAVVLVAAGLGQGLSYAQAISDTSQIPRMMGVGLVYVPAVWLIIGLAVLGFGWLPRAASAIAWTALGLCFFIALFADLVDLPAWLRNASPFAQTPEAPLESVTATPLLGIAAVVAVLLAGGFVGFRRRDVG